MDCNGKIDSSGFPNWGLTVGGYQGGSTVKPPSPPPSGLMGNDGAWERVNCGIGEQFPEVNGKGVRTSLLGWGLIRPTNPSSL